MRWHEAGGQTLDSAAQATYLITTTVQPNACNVADPTNTARATFGCDVGDVCLGVEVSADAVFDTRPVFSVNAINTSLNQCGPGPIRIDFSNTGARAANVVLSYTLPAGFAYAGLAGGTTPAPATEPAPGATGTLTWSYTEIAQTSDNSVRFTVTNESGQCAADSPLGTADLAYEDTCGNLYDDVTADNNRLTVQRPAYEGTLANGAFQVPVTRTVESGQTYQWNIGIRNGGTGAGRNVLITETLAADYTIVGASVSTGSGGGAGIVPLIAGQVITWFIPSWNAGGQFNAVISATVPQTPAELGLQLDISSSCDNGSCFQQEPTFRKYATALNLFDKSLSPAQVRIGDLATTTIEANLFGTYLYTDTVLTDTLPQGLGYLSSELVVVTDVDGDAGGPITNTIITPDGTPAQKQSGEIRWDLGVLNGQVLITGVITAVVVNILENQDGVVLTNRAQLSYVDDGQPYEFDDAANTEVIEPDLEIAKQASASEPIVAGDRVTYTLEVNHSPASRSDAHGVEIVDAIPERLTFLPGTLETSPPASAAVASDQGITVNYDLIGLVSPTILITYVVTIDDDAEPSSILTNTAVVSYTSMPGPNPDERTGGGGINDYEDNTEASVRTADVEISKVLLDDREYTIGEAITYTLFMTVPTGLTRLDPLVTDFIPAGLRYDPAQSFLKSDNSACVHIACLCHRVDSQYSDAAVQRQH